MEKQRNQSLVGLNLGLIRSSYDQHFSSFIKLKHQIVFFRIIISPFLVLLPFRAAKMETTRRIKDISKKISSFVNNFKSIFASKSVTSLWRFGVYVITARVCWCCRLLKEQHTHTKKEFALNNFFTFCFCVLTKLATVS